MANETISAEERASIAAENAEALSNIDDSVRGDLPPVRTPEPPPSADDKQITPPKQRVDDKRNSIVERFRSHRTEEAEDVDRVSDFQRSGLPQEFGAPIPDLETAEAPIVPAGEAGQEGADLKARPQEQAPPKRKLKIRGEEREYTEEEITAAAQKALAAENYLDEAKGKLGEVDELLKSIKNTAQHQGQPGTHPAGQNTVQPGEREPAPPVDPQHPEDDPLQRAIDLIQYGDPAEARAVLDQAVEQKATRVATAVVRDTLQADKFKDDAARTAKVLNDFASQHPEIAEDDFARVAIEQQVYKEQVADLKALGVDPAKIPTRTGLVTPADIAEAHRWYRTQGYKVRPPQDLLTTAHGKFMEWRGTPKPNGDPVDPNPQPSLPPRVQVSVDRDQRRQAIPQQPSRSAAPRQITPQQPAPARDRSDIVLAMKQRRALPRGQAV